MNGSLVGDDETKNRRLEVLDYVESLGSPNNHAPRTKIVIGEEEEELILFFTEKRLLKRTPQLLVRFYW